MQWINKPKRLEKIFQKHSFPVYFVTAVTARRRPILDSPLVHQALVDYASHNLCEGRAMGRYVVMPDHIHFLVRIHQEARLSDYVRLLKQKITIALRQKETNQENKYVWQTGFFDRPLRSSERTSKAWQYMIDNPLQAGLAKVPEDWPYQGDNRN